MPTNRHFAYTLSFSLLALLAPAARAGHNEPPYVPPTLKVPADQKLKLDAIGRGYQIYECRIVPANPSSAEWVFLYPEATLLDPDDMEDVLGTHFAGPTWQANDGSTVVASVLARVAAPDPTAIDWLLLGNTTHFAENGKFSRISYIHRLDTFGGIKPPACACDLGQVGTVARVPYEAHYYFYVPHDQRR